ncbi:MAG TPA: CopY/TcrY family copper transport repressor [Candidatus Limosilactobacillus merdipullorum]|uniref:CopY/TcrY family copper transport repressor n=1 Tax=Candidatus Limosilactobacillus merdipullorum TaxID=2838653 RepID=A0A9D1QRZ4_9LACO|nr:CopY/TcrY family copper transport repressor [Candidatus Limosilactobacillus merdipullorum]
MPDNELQISPAEWQVMRVVWTRGSVTSTELTHLLADSTGWQSATVKTLLRRLVKKGFVATTRHGRAFQYTPLVKERETMEKMADQLFDSLCAHQQGATLAEVVKHVTLSKSDIANLQTILTAKEATAPQEVACNCIGCEHHQTA